LQELAGHSTPVLTARYAHRRLHDLAGAVEKLPSILPQEASSEALQATGTDLAAAGPYTLLTQTADTGRDRVRLAEGTAAREDSDQPCSNLSETKELRPSETGCEEVRERPLPDSNRGMADLQSAALPLG
jgi:hypothetical protein